MADATPLIATALAWQYPHVDPTERARLYIQVYARLGDTLPEQVVLHDLAMRLVRRQQGPNDEGARRLVLEIFDTMAKAREAL